MRGNSSGCQVLSHQEWGPRGPRRGWSELHGWVPEEEMLRGTFENEQAFGQAGKEAKTSMQQRKDREA